MRLSQKKEKEKLKIEKNVSFVIDLFLKGKTDNLNTSRTEPLSVGHDAIVCPLESSQ